MTANTHDFSATLNRLMAERKMTVKQAALVAAVSTSKIQSWRSGSRPTDYLAVRKLADALGVTFSFLLTGLEDVPTKNPSSLTEVLADGGEVFDGICQITIRRLVPRGRHE